MKGGISVKCDVSIRLALKRKILFLAARHKVVRLCMHIYVHLHYDPISNTRVVGHNRFPKRGDALEKKGLN